MYDTKGGSHTTWIGKETFVAILSLMVVKDNSSCVNLGVCKVCGMKSSTLLVSG